MAQQWDHDHINHKLGDRSRGSCKQLAAANFCVFRPTYHRYPFDHTLPCLPPSLWHLAHGDNLGSYSKHLKTSTMNWLLINQTFAKQPSMATANFIHPKPRIPDLLWCAQISPKTFLVTSPLSLLTSKPQLDRRISFLGVKRHVPWSENRWHPSQDTWSMIVCPVWLKKGLCDLALVFISYWKWRKLLSSSLFFTSRPSFGKWMRTSPIWCEKFHWISDLHTVESDWKSSRHTNW